jgi:hypothetical protein
MDSISISVADVAASLTVGLILWGIKSVSVGRKEIVGSVERLGLKVAETNGRVIKLETEIVDHIKQDDKEFQRLADEQEKQWEKINTHIERRKA